MVNGYDPSWRFGAYVADTWKVKPYFTITAGVRWSVDTDRANQDLPTPLCSSVAPSEQFTGCTGNTPLFDQYQVGLGQKTHQPYANFGPQAGFVFSPGSHKLSIRGGAGIFYESSVFNNTGNARSEIIQGQTAAFADAGISPGQTRVNLPGFGVVTASPDGTPLKTIDTESIALAAPELNAIKAEWQAKVKNVLVTNPGYIGTGGGLNAGSIYGAPYVSPYSIQINGGVQQELAKGFLISADYVHNATLKVPLTVDVNHNGAARTLNTAAAQNAISATVSAYPACPQGSSAASINCAIANGAMLADFSTNGLDSGSTYLGGNAASAFGLTPATGAAFPGTNPNVGSGRFILPVGKSGYDALQVVLQQQKAHPLPGIVSTNLQVSYTLSRIVTATGGGNPDQFFQGAGPWNNDSPTSIIGRSSLDHSNELSFGGSLIVHYGVQVGFISHFYSATPSSLTLDTGSAGSGQIFLTDLNGDGTTGDLVPGTNPGYYEHQVKHNLNSVINNYNATNAGQLTAAGNALVNAKLFTFQQLSAIGAVQQALAPAPAVPLSNAALRTFDLSASYPIQLSRFREGLRLTPGVAMYNVFNMSNFGGFGGTLLNTSDAGTPQYLNSPYTQTNLDVNRTVRNSGTFDQGGPRTTEFQLKLNF